MTTSRLLMVLACVLLLSERAFAQESPDALAKELYDSLQASIAALDSCHLVIANRGNNVVVEGNVRNFDVQFVDLWVVGDDLQLHERDDGSIEADSWADGFPGNSAPLTTETLDSVAGRKACFRPAGDKIWADYITIPAEKAAPYRTLYSTSSSLQQAGLTNVFAPLILLNRKWCPPERRGDGPMVDRVSECPLERWKVIGREEVNGLATIKVEIARQETVPFPIKKHGGDLFITPVWICWFSESMGHVPVRVVSSVRYEFNGKRYSREPAAGTPDEAEYLASDFRNVFDDVWYPFSGVYRYYVQDDRDQAPAGGTAGVPLTLETQMERIVDRLLADGQVTLSADRVLGGHREWKILKLEKISTGVDLWFDAPDGACLRDVDTQSFRIQGKTDEESRAILGGPEDTGAGPRPIVATPAASTGRVVFFFTNAALALVAAVYLVRKWRRSR